MYWPGLVFFRHLSLLKKLAGLVWDSWFFLLLFAVIQAFL